MDMPFRFCVNHNSFYVLNMLRTIIYDEDFIVSWITLILNLRKQKQIPHMCSKIWQSFLSVQVGLVKWEYISSLIKCSCDVSRAVSYKQQTENVLFNVIQNTFDNYGKELFTFDFLWPLTSLKGSSRGRCPYFAGHFL